MGEICPMNMVNQTTTQNPTTQNPTINNSKHFHNSNIHNSSFIIHNSRAGFTLIEVLVSMVLVAMITLVMALAFQLSIQAWERGEKEGENYQISVVLPSLLEKQLRFVKKSAVFGGQKGQIPLDFLGENGELDFFTIYSPQGTPRQGLVRVFYRFDEEKKILNVYESLISNRDNLDHDPPEEMEEVGLISKVSHFDLQFLSGKDVDKNMDASQFIITNSSFKEIWPKNSKSLPAFVRLTFALEGDKSPRRWLIKVGNTL